LAESSRRVKVPAEALGPGELNPSMIGTSGGPRSHKLPMDPANSSIQTAIRFRALKSCRNGGKKPLSQCAAALQQQLSGTRRSQASVAG